MPSARPINGRAKSQETAPSRPQSTRANEKEKDRRLKKRRKGHNRETGT